MQDVTKELKAFQEFLTNSVSTVLSLKQATFSQGYNESLVNDFYQANWEILVEAIVCQPGKEFLEVYGEGADCNENSSRIFLPHNYATHKITCSSSKVVENIISGETIDLAYYRFNSFVLENDLDDNKPFQIILLEHLTDDSYAIIRSSNISFHRVPV